MYNCILPEELHLFISERFTPVPEPEFDPYVSGHRIFMIRPPVWCTAMTAWGSMNQYYDLTIPWDEYYVRHIIQDSIKNFRYHLPKIKVEKITPDMIHYPDDWVPPRKPWLDEAETTNEQRWTWYDDKRHPKTNSNQFNSIKNRKEKKI